MVIPEAKTIAASANVTTQNEPWVLAKTVAQCFFIKDPSKPSHVVVRRGKRNIAGMDGVAHEQDFGQYGDPKLEDDDDDDDTRPYTPRRSRTTLLQSHQVFRSEDEVKMFLAIIIQRRPRKAKRLSLNDAEI